MMLKLAAGAALLAGAMGARDFAHVNKPVRPNPTKVERMEDVQHCFEAGKTLRVKYPEHPSLEERTLKNAQLWFDPTKPHKVWVICAGKVRPSNKSRQYICMHHASKNFYYFKDNSPDKVNHEECPPCRYPGKDDDLAIDCPIRHEMMYVGDSLETATSVYCEPTGEMAPMECPPMMHMGRDEQCHCSDGFRPKPDAGDGVLDIMNMDMSDMKMSGMRPMDMTKCESNDEPCDRCGENETGEGRPKPPPTYPTRPPRGDDDDDSGRPDNDPRPSSGPDDPRPTSGSPDGPRPNSA